MKALTIKQPWAQLIIEGLKDIENRTWQTKFRGRVYVHAAQKPVPMNGNADGFAPPNIECLKQIFKLHPASQGRWPDIMAAYTNSAIIGEVDIVDCVLNHNSIWAEHVDMPAGVYMGEKLIYNWVLANPVKYDQPILNVKGALSFWQPDLSLITESVN